MQKDNLKRSHSYSTILLEMHYKRSQKTKEVGSTLRPLEVFLSWPYQDSYSVITNVTQASLLFLYAQYFQDGPSCSIATFMYHAYPQYFLISCTLITCLSKVIINALAEGYLFYPGTTNFQYIVLFTGWINELTNCKNFLTSESYSC